MLVLLGVGFLAGLITALSPCVLPVLPIVLAGGASGRRPFPIIAGLVGSFTLFTLTAAWLLDRLGLPQDLLRNIAIALLFIVAATLLVPQLGDLVARPLERLARRPAGDLGGGVLLGASLGLVFVPCAGPVLAAITVLVAKSNVGAEGVLLTIAYALGAAVPLLAIAIAGRSVAGRLRSRADLVRRTAGVVILGTAIAIAFGFDRNLQTFVPGYTQAVQDRVEQSTSASKELRKLTGAHELKTTSTPPAADTSGLPDYGVAPDFAGITEWLNSTPLTLAGLRGKVVLIDFWTYSCINCLRTLPHVEAWATRYRRAGLVVVGVHTPEFAFEHVPSNVKANARRLGVHYPIAIDNGYGTWNAWGNQYWPAEYLIDRNGRIRTAHFGEGEYDKTEAAIRTLLSGAAGSLPPNTTGIADTTPTGTLTPESYLGAARLARYAGNAIVPGRPHDYRLPAHLALNDLAYGETWTVERERIVAGQDARLRLEYLASKVYIVLGGSGTMTAWVDDQRSSSIRVDGDRLYTAVDGTRSGRHLLELRFSPGVLAYSFTFG
jgi:cytochrome c biogenesis protein CcdA/thiol-disulfide isomerase/thioredoxin